jgi:Meckel syndrome type 1 protein
VDALRPLSLDQFAGMTAEMEAGFPRDRVLEMATVSQEQWDLTQETWLLRMAKQGQQRKLALLDRYNELLAKHRKAAQRKMRAEKRKLKGPMPVAPEAHLSPIARSRADEGGATFQKPSFAEAAAPFVAPVQPAGPAWIAGTPGGAPALVTPPPVIAVPVIAPPIAMGVPAGPSSSAPPRVAGNGGAAPPEAPAVAGPAWLQGPAAGSVEVTASGERSPLAAMGPAWLQQPTGGPAAAAPAVAATDKASVEVTASGERSPLAAMGPAWLSAKAPPRTESPRPAPPPPPAGVAALAGPAWLQSSASFAGIAAPPAAAQPAPAVAQVAANAPAQVTAPAQVPKKHDLGSTVGSDFVQSPFAGPAWAAAQAKAAAAQGKGDGAAAKNATDALPFQRVAPPAAPSMATSAPAVAATPAAGGLPFQRPATAPQAQPAPQAAASAPHAQPAPQAAASAPHAQPAPQAAASAPHAQPASHPATAAASPQARPAGPRLSVEQLAWLQAQIETSAELGRAARESLALSDADYAAERAFWQARFQQDRAAVERYSQLFYHYRRPR